MQLQCSRHPTTLHNNIKSELPDYLPWPILVKPLACGFAENLKCANNPCQWEELCRAPHCKKAKTWRNRSPTGELASWCIPRPSQERIDVPAEPGCDPFSG